jgi:uncharacterized coiled-coil protein SlyX
MILDLIVILLVIILSCLFCMNDKSNKVNTSIQYCKLSHIVIGLTVIVFYKLVRYYKIQKEIKKIDNIKSNIINTEKFTVEQSINDFIANTTDIIVNQDEKTLSDSMIKKYTDTINNLTTQIRKLNDTQIAQNDKSNNPQAITNIDTIGLENQQAFQELQIDYLSKQIQSAQDVINQNTVSSNAINYKPIKLYSSCVANANGTMTAEQPVKDSFINNSLNPLQSVQNSNGAQQILNTSSQSSSNSQSNLDLTSLLHKLLSK